MQSTRTLLCGTARIHDYKQSSVSGLELPRMVFASLVLGHTLQVDLVSLAIHVMLCLLGSLQRIQEEG